MEIHMHKRLVTLSIFPFAIGDAITVRLLQLQDWNAARRLRKAGRKRAEAVAELTQRALYDIGESDLRPPRSPLWDANPYRFLIDGIMNRGPSEFGPRR
jgi:hypothetical protein